MRDSVLGLYRKLLREAGKVSAKNVSKKIKQNVRDMFLIYRTEEKPQKIEALLDEGENALLVLKGILSLSDDDARLLFSDFL